MKIVIELRRLGSENWSHYENMFAIVCYVIIYETVSYKNRDLKVTKKILIDEILTLQK